jgi:hypothetical protein
LLEQITMLAMARLDAEGNVQGGRNADAIEAEATET